MGSRSRQGHSKIESMAGTIRNAWLFWMVLGALKTTGSSSQSPASDTLQGGSCVERPVEELGAMSQWSAWMNRGLCVVPAVFATMAAGCAEGRGPVRVNGFSRSSTLGSDLRAVPRGVTVPPPSIGVDLVRHPDTARVRDSETVQARDPGTAQGPLEGGERIGTNDNAGRGLRPRCRPSSRSRGLPESLNQSRSLQPHPGFGRYTEKEYREAV